MKAGTTKRPAAKAPTTQDYRRALAALVAVLPKCSVYNDETGEGCGQPATHDIDGPHDWHEVFCAKHAKEFRDGQPYPHRWLVGELQHAKPAEQAAKLLARAGGAR